MTVWSDERRIRTDVLVIGGGMAGMFAAIKAREQGLDVTLTDKAYVGKAGSSHHAEGDTLFFRKSKDDLNEWLDIISKRCEYLNSREWDAICLLEAEDRHNDLLSWGVRFWEKDGRLYVFDTSDVGAPPSAYQDITMQARKATPILRRVALERGVRVLDNVMMVELLRRDDEVAGAVGFHVRGGRMHVIEAKATVIATGSANFKAEAYPTHFWTGDGEAMAYRAGAAVTGKEFAGGATSNRHALKRQQKEAEAGEPLADEIFEQSYEHPWAIGAGAWSGWYTRITLNAEGGPVVMPAWEAHCGRAPLYFDTAMPPKKMEWMREYFKRIPAAWDEGDKIDLDIFRGGKFKWPSSRIAGASLYGTGIWPVDTDCAAGPPGLYAAGNSCATRGSGAVYAGMGFAMNHAMVTGARAGLAAAKHASETGESAAGEVEIERARAVVRAPLGRKGGFSPAWVTQMIQTITVPYFYLKVKHAERLEAAIRIVEFINGHLVPLLMADDAHAWRLAHETRNMALTAEMKLRASLFRTESRGDHFREDFPRRDDPDWLAWVKLRDDQGAMRVSREPVPEEWWPDLTKPYEERYPALLPMEQ